jgi:hypothetical protein
MYKYFQNISTQRSDKKESMIALKRCVYHLKEHVIERQQIEIEDKATIDFEFNCSTVLINNGSSRSFQGQRVNKV